MFNEFLKMLNFNPWWKSCRIQILLGVLFFMIRPFDYLGLFIVLAISTNFTIKEFKKNIYKESKDIDLKFIFSCTYDLDKETLLDNIDQKVSSIFKENNLKNTDIDGIMILESSNSEKLKYNDSLKVLKKEFSSKINPKFKRAIVSRFSKHRIVNYLNRSILISLNEPEKKLLTFILTYKHYIIEFFYICELPQKTENAIEKYKKDVEQAYNYLFPEKLLPVDRIEQFLNEILISAYQYIDGIIILNISNFSHSHYSKYFQVEQKIFKNEIIEVDKLINIISNKENFSRLDILSKIYLELVLNCLASIELLSFYLFDKDDKKYAIVFWTKVPVEQFNTGQYHAVYQYKIRECADHIREQISSLLKIQ